MAKSDKPKYIAVCGMNVNCTEQDPQGQRIESGDAVPDIDPEDLKALLASGDIKEA